MPVDPSIQRKVDSLSSEAEKLRAQHQATQSAQSDKLKNDLEMLKNKKEQMLDAEKKRSANLANQSENSVYDVTELIDAMLNEKAATGGFDYEKQVNDTLKKMGKAHPDSGTAGSSADAPDAKFTHNGEEHNLEIKQNSKAMYGQIELKHNGKEWDISERSKKKYPETYKAIHGSGFLKKVNKQWEAPTGDYDEDLKMGNVYHDHPDAEPIKAHYGKDRKTNYIQIGGGHGFYHTGNDAAGLGSPELDGKTQFRARMKYRGTDKKTGKKKYGALIVMGLKDASKSHHNLDDPNQKEWINYLMNGSQVISETALNSKDPHGDYQAKRKALHDLSLNKDVDQKEVQQRRLDLDKEYSKYKKENTMYDLDSLNENFTLGFQHGQAEEIKKNPYEKGSDEYNRYEDGFWQGLNHRRVTQVHLESKAPVAPAPFIHRIAVTVSEPDHPAVTKRNETQQKFVRVHHHTDNKEDAVARGKKHFAKKGYKVHDAHHVSMNEATSTVKTDKDGKVVSWSHEGDWKKTNPKKNPEGKVHNLTGQALKQSQKLNKEEVELEEARSTAERLAVAKQMYDSAMRSARSPAERAQAKETYDNVVKRLKEEVAANNVSSGGIAGTQGDAGKKVVMTKQPLKRKLVSFKEACDCWKGYKRKPGTKPCEKDSCVKEDSGLDEAAIDAKGHKSSTGGLTQKGVDAYRRENPGSKLQTAVTTKPSKLDPDSKDAKRRKSFCARMSGVEGPMKDENGKPTRKALALRKWNC